MQTQALHSAWHWQEKEDRSIFNPLSNRVTLTVWLWQVRWLPRLSFPSCRAEASFTSTARRRACSRLLLLGTAREAPRCCAETFPALPMGLCPVPQGVKGLTPLTRVSGSFGMWLCLPGQPGFDVISFFPAPSFHLFTWFFAFSRRVSAVPHSPTTDSCAHRTPVRV